MNAHEMKKLAQKNITKSIPQLSVNIEPAIIDNHVAKILNQITKAANSGSFTINYQIKVKNSEQLLMQLAQSFKEKYPSFFLVSDLGKQSILISWE